MSQSNRNTPFRSLPPLERVSDRETPLISHAEWFVRNLPDHETFVEPYASRGTLLPFKSPSRNEVVHDPSGDIQQFYEVLRDQPEQLATFLIQANIDSQQRREWQQAWARGYRHHDSLIRGSQFIFSHWGPQNPTTTVVDSLGTLPRPFAPSGRENQENVHEALLALRDRFSEVVIEDQDIEVFLERYSGPDSFMFIPMGRRNALEYASPQSNPNYAIERCLEWDYPGVQYPYWMIVSDHILSPLEPWCDTMLGDSYVTSNYTLSETNQYVPNGLEQFG